MCVGGTRQYRLDSMSLSASMSAARNFGAALVIAALRPPGWPLADDAALVISELVTSAVKAGAGQAEVGVEVHVDEVAVTVTDDRAAGAASPAQSSTPETELGRSMVAAVAAAHGTSAASGRTTAWARLACDPGYTSQVSCERR